MITHFPLRGPKFEHQFGIAALDSNQAISVATDDHENELALRNQLLDSQYRDDYLADSSDAELAVQQFTTLLCRRSDVLNLRNGKINQQQNTDSILMEAVTLDWLGRTLQEDFAIMQNDPSRGYPLIAGCVCFPSGWTIREKVGQSILAIHEGVPDFDTALHPATQRLMQRLKPERTVYRTNWGIRPSPQLDQSPRHAPYLQAETEKITGDNAGTRCFFRVEFQTLTRLTCGDIVFMIRTEQCPLNQLTPEQQRFLHGTLNTCPESTLAYKGILAMQTSLLRFLGEQ